MKRNLIYQEIEKLYPSVSIELENWDATDWKLLFCVILTAQATEKQVNKITRVLFERYKTLQSFSDADHEELSEVIKTVSFRNTKSKYLIRSAKLLLENFEGKVPNNIGDLTSLPGVGQKIANLVINTLFKESQGIAVDTHVKRVSKRLGLSSFDKPEEIALDLQSFIPKKDWNLVSTRLFAHGQRICRARKPLCTSCRLSEYCSYKTSLIN